MPATTLIWTGATDGVFATAGNWSPAQAPASGDSVIFPVDATVDVDGSDQSAILLVNMWAEPGCNISLGSAAAYLQLDVDYLYWAGTGVSYLDVDNSTLVSIDDCAAGATGAFGLYLKGDGAAHNTQLSLSYDVAGDVGLGFTADMTTSETCQFTTIRVAGGILMISEKVTATTLDQNGGTIYNRANLTTVTQTKNGTLYHERTATIGTLVADGVVYYDSNGTLTTGTITSNGTLDFSRDPRPVTITNALQVYGGAVIRDPRGRVTWTAGFKTNKCSLTDVTLDLVTDKTWTPT